MKVKICGITNLEDAMMASKCGASALGFVFYEKSPRYISPKEVKKITSKLPPFIQKVGVFVDDEDIEEIFFESGINIAQLHNEEISLHNLHIPHLKVVRAIKKEDIQIFSDEYRIIDAFVEEFGGCGKRIPLEWFKDVDCSKIILAGGIDIYNIKDVIKYQFYGVDVSSGVELNKQKKDFNLVEKLIKQVMEAEN